MFLNQGVLGGLSGEGVYLKSKSLVQRELLARGVRLPVRFARRSEKENYRILTCTLAINHPNSRTGLQSMKHLLGSSAVALDFREGLGFRV